MLSMGISYAKDLYFNLVVLLLKIDGGSVTGAITPTTTPFLVDSSTNNFTASIIGDTKSDKFSPLWGDGYYGNWFDGTTGYLTVANNASFNLSTNNFTIECWVHTMTATQLCVMEKRTGASYDWIIFLNEVANYLTIYITGIVTKGQATVTFPFGQWVHIALVRNGTTFTLYQNGVNVYTTTNAAAVTYNAANAIVIGVDTGSGNRFFWPGYIAAVRIVNGTAMYTSAFTPPTTALTAVDNTVLLTCQARRIVDTSSLASTVTIAGTVKVVPATPMQATLPSTVSSYGSGYFDGTGDALSISNNSAFNFGTGDLTVEFWLYSAVAWSSQPASCGIVGQKAGDATNGWVFYKDGGTPTKLNARFALTNNFPTATDVPSFQWVHYTFTRSGTTTSWYMNGTLDTTGTNSASISDGSGLMYIGFSQTWSGYFNGYISNLRVINGTAVAPVAGGPVTPPTIVPNTQLLTLQNSGGGNNYNINENSYYDHAVTRFGNASVSTFTPFSNSGYSMYFNGTTDAVYTTAPMPTSGDFTIECWFWLSGNLTYQYTGGGYGARLISGVGTGVMEFVLTGNPAPGGFGCTSYGNSNFPLSGAASISLRDWHHVAVVRSGTNAAIFFDGARIGTLSSSNTFTAGNAGIGGQSTATGYINWFPGYISNVRILTSAAYDPTQTTMTVPTKPFDVTSTTTLLIGQDNRIVDQSVTRATFTYSGTPQIQAVGPFGSYNKSQAGYSIYFSGAEQISAPTSANYNQVGDFTMEAWVYPTISQGAEAFIIGEETANKLKLVIATLTPTVINPTVGTVITSSVVLTVKNWYHLAVVRSGTGTNNVKLYVNGALAGQTTFTTDANSATTFNIGGRAAATYFTGYISNARYVVGTAVYTSAFTPSTSQLDVIPNTKFYIGPRLVNACIQEFAFQPTLTITGTPKVSPLNPFTYTYTSPYPYQPSVHGGSLALDGTGDYLQLPQTTAIWNMGTYDFSIEAWVYPTARVTNGAYILASSNYGVGTDFLFQILNAGTLQIYLLTGTVATSTATIPLYQWTHVCVIKISNVYTLYVNGLKDGTVTLATTIPSTYIPTIGNSSNNTGTTYFPGFISGLKVSKGVARLPYSANFYPLSTPPIPDATGTILLMNGTSGAILDSSMKSNFETVGGVVISGTAKNSAGSIYFPGSSYLLGTTRPVLTLTSDFTVEFWVKGGTQPGSYPVILSRNATYASGNFYLSFSHSTAAGKISLHHTTYGSPFYQHPTTVTDNVWHHVALVRIGGSVTLYVDGVGTTAYTGTAATVTWDWSIPVIGNNPSDGGATVAQLGFVGYIDEFRITKYGRYSSNFTPAPLITQ